MQVKAGGEWVTTYEIGDKIYGTSSNGEYITDIRLVDESGCEKNE